MKLSLEERPLEADEVIEFEEIKVVIHERDAVYFNNVKLDFVEDVFGKGRFQLLKI
ncbi:hypothetical protein [Bacillus sp. V3-13]|uniref:hypothetical protein n=1 Tax=Bacillus sp. V3-13 TaxID=2053728 RepID=UPI0015E143D4|nr:hypothetical protein [Bacillus sp. V3-13]